MNLVCQALQSIEMARGYWQAGIAQTKSMPTEWERIDVALGRVRGIAHAQAFAPPRARVPLLRRQASERMISPLKSDSRMV